MLHIFSDFAINGILYYFIALNFCYLLLSLRAFRAVRCSYFEWRYGEISSFMHNSLVLPKITVLIPAYNEERRIVETIQGIMKSNYTNLELIVINDASTDQTMSRLLAAFDLMNGPVYAVKAYSQQLACKPIIKNVSIT